MMENEDPVLNAEAASSAPGDAASATASVDSVLRSPGQTLDTPTRASFEPRLGWGLSGVQIHTDPAAQRSARDVQGHGYTVGQHIVFGAGRFAPGTGAVGRRLLDVPANVTP